MDKLLKTLKGKDANLTAAYGIFGLSALYIFYNGQLATIGLAIGVALILQVTTSHNLAVSLVGGALAGLIAVHFSRRSAKEGYTNGTAIELPAVTSTNEEPFEDAGKKEEKKEAFEGPMKPAPDHSKRGEFFELGKKYKGPSEEDDGDFHLDAGTTFLNAYKSLKPDQLASMTKDTQELMQTQRQLMSTLASLKPLIQDGKEMMDMFQGYFGDGKNSMN
jgi:hypothetical protein